MSPYPRGGQNSFFYKEFYRETTILAGGRSARAARGLGNIPIWFTSILNPGFWFRHFRFWQNGCGRLLFLRPMDFLDRILFKKIKFWSPRG